MIVGILGCGAIASIIVNNFLSKDSGIDIKYFYDHDMEKAENLATISDGIAVLDIDDMIDNVDLVLEAASPISVEKFGLKVLKKGKNIIIMSIGALMDNKFRDRMIEAATNNDAKIFAPSGAIVGLDGIKAASIGKIIKATLTTRKPPRSLGKLVDEEEILYEGKASEAVKIFPVNINVAAALSIACNLDVDVKIIVDPKVDKNVHEVIVEGDFGQFKTRTENLPCEVNPKTSMLAAYSAIKLLKSLNENFIMGT
ncbi:aspartate dehydrogenase [Methanobrevibacter arboriphilus]|jgi:aspartate dehydrogenase|uniref:Aspartate dehydrogenase n=1 Tax=Methanobrevibacter arboriphilus TaxID=39441 RepID=A0ACA8R4W0_METAZ|nr:aspartate dehydrogenase [Methanobrevibacter arboriphilus]MCC7562265.1 aspartate dehydrogenase [Methanobrevibacter arboriphilus]BBL62720.1 aspartate dehydrogenase [Methanobrevibacter arboriphilus]GLI11960.1 aspartate dehydrogenase [Methanobrevibacter arboriphilus]